VDYNSTATYVYAMTAKRSGDVPIIRCNLLGNHLGTVAGTYVHYSLFKKQFCSYKQYFISTLWGISGNTPQSKEGGIPEILPRMGIIKKHSPQRHEML
jgi:hypothetical protein